MDNGRLLLAIVLTIALIVGTNLLFPPAPPPAPQGPEERPGDRVERPVTEPERSGGLARQQLSPEVEGDAAVATQQPAPAGPALGSDETASTEEALPPADTVVVSSPLYRFGFSTRGGALVSAELLHYESFTRPGPVQLVPEDARALLDYRLEIGRQIVDLGRWNFRVEPEGGLTLEPGGGPDTLRFIYEDPESDFQVQLAYVFRPDRYVIGVRGHVRGLGRASPRVLLDIGPALAANEAEVDRSSLTYVVNSTAEGIEGVSLGDVEGERIEEGPLRWAALRNKYFVAAAISEGEDAGQYFGGLIVRDAEGEHAARLTATLPVGRDEAYAYTLYLGPQEHDRLAVAAASLEDVNPVGWEIFRPILRPLVHLITWALVGLHDFLGLGYGWVLILFGVMMRVVLWPLYGRAQKSQLKNMEVQPKLKEIQEKYKDKPEQLQKEMMRLYKEEGFNPLGGCLPMLVPYPILITLFFVFQQTIAFRGVEFLWLPDLSRPDPYYILPLILGLSMFITQWMNARSTSQQNPQMKWIMYGMPVFMVIIFFNLAAGLNLYYAASNLASIPQQMQITGERRRVRGRMEASPAGD